VSEGKKITRKYRVGWGAYSSEYFDFISLISPGVETGFELAEF
jgi:hypothetical protein